MSGVLRPGAGSGRAGECTQCGVWVADGPDACLGLLPGVTNACCGHGDSGQAYVQLGGELTIRGRDATAFFALIRKAQSVQANKGA